MGKKLTEGHRLLGAHCSIAGGVENAPLAGGLIGATAIQLFTGSNQQWPARHAFGKAMAGGHAQWFSAAQTEAFQRNMNEQGIRIAVAHACYLINLAAPDPAIWRKSIDAMEGEIERASALGIPWVIVHPGSHKGNGLEWGIKRIAEALNSVLDATEALSAGVALETTAGQGASIGGRFEELASIIAHIDDKRRVKVCFDTCHSFAAGYELCTKEGYARTWREFDEAIEIRNLVAMHLNDSQGKLGSRIDRHAPIGKGRIGLPGFRLIMNDRRFADIPMILETPKEGDAVRSDTNNLKILKRLVRA